MSAALSTTTEIGDAFRDLVCDLLRTQYPDAQVEQRIDGTKVDILFSRYDFGTRIVFAVECKDYAGALTKSFIAEKVRSHYDPLLQSGKVHRVLIVSRKPLGADASAFVAGWRNASHLTYEQLAESLMGLRVYMQTLAELRPTDETDYIEARIEGHDGNAIDIADAWVKDGPRHGVAILGGYGQGKTSFARHLAAHYARRHLDEPTERMPILLRLGEVVHETQLEGLFGKEFTARNPAPGYQFRTLEHLNRSGRLLVILDGFDEMKHAMTPADFQANFREFNRLLVGQAKVFLLGRPNALPSGERELVFRGQTRVADQMVSSATFAEWTEWKLAFFSEPETRRLLVSSLSTLQVKHAAAGRYRYAEGFVDTRVAQIFQQVPADLLRRPVHVQLVAEVAADPGFDLRGFTQFKLYDHFIRKMVERDTVEKQARRAIPLEARLTFQRDLAWWAWRRPGASQGCFYRHEVPTTLLKDLPEGNAVDEEGKRNEYIVSTLTEEKETGILFFAHRSFQEFLVAERLRLGTSSPAAHVDYSAYLTDDVVGFLRQAPNAEYIVGWYETLRGAAGPLAAGYLEFFASFPNLLEHMRKTTLSGEPHEIDTWSVCILYLAGRAQTQGALDPKTLRSLFSEVIRKGQSDAAAVATLAMLGMYQERPEPEMLVQITASLLERCLRASRPDSNGSSLIVSKDDADFATTWLADSVRKRFPRGGELSAVSLGFDLAVLEVHCAKELHPKGATGAPLNPFGDSSFSGAAASVQVEAGRVYSAVDRGVRAEHSTYLHDRRQSFVLVQVDHRRRGSPAGGRTGR